MSQDIEGLTKQWIRAFGEPPAIVDPVLMRAVLAALGGDGEGGREK